MSVKIRLSKIGKKNSPSYRIVAVATRSKRDGETLDILGFYNPNSNPPQFEVDKEKVKSWQAKGALLTSAVEEIIEGKYTYTKYNPKGSKEVKGVGEKVATVEEVTETKEPKEGE